MCSEPGIRVEWNKVPDLKPGAGGTEKNIKKALHTRVFLVNHQGCLDWFG